MEYKGNVRLKKCKWRENCLNPTTVGKVYTFPDFKFDNGEVLNLRNDINFWTEEFDFLSGDEAVSKLTFNYLIL